MPIDAAIVSVLNASGCMIDIGAFKRGNAGGNLNMYTGMIMMAKDGDSQSELPPTA